MLFTRRIPQQVAARCIATPHTASLLHRPAVTAKHALRSFFSASSLRNSPSNDAGNDDVAAVPRLSYPFGLSQIDGLIDEYRDSSGIPSSSIASGVSTRLTLSSIHRQVSTECHALELDQHLREKCLKNTSKQAKQIKQVYTELASRIDILEAEVTQMAGTMVTERFHKQFVLYPPTPPAPSSSSATTAASPHSPASSTLLPLVDGLRFDCRWSLARHSVRRELAPYEFEARWTITPFRVIQDEADGTTRSEDLQTITFLQANESALKPIDGALLEQIRRLYGGEEVTQRDFVWLLAFLASHPSDDAVSRHQQHRPDETSDMIISHFN